MDLFVVSIVHIIGLNLERAIFEGSLRILSPFAVHSEKLSNHIAMQEKNSIF